LRDWYPSWQRQRRVFLSQNTPLFFVLFCFLVLFFGLFVLFVLEGQVGVWVVGV
jgi:hypothetical protein